MKYTMYEVQNWDDLKNAGDYLLCNRSQSDPGYAIKGLKVAIIVCPKCLRASSCSDHVTVQESPLTIRASYLCNQHVGTSTSSKMCGWHGWVTDGVMEGD